MNAPLLVYKDRTSDTWYWQCRVPLCGANEWTMGGQAGTARAALDHLSKHRNVGFSRDSSR